MINTERLIDGFMELVQVDSETKNEQKISEVLKRKISAHGLEWKEDDAAARSGQGANNLFVQLPSHGVKSSVSKIFFCSHMDTVTPGKNIRPAIGEDGYIRSDGTTILGSDDKAGVAALLEAMKVLQENNVPHGDVQFILTVGEENSLAGSRAMNPDLILADFGFVLDGKGEVGQVVTHCTAKAAVQMRFRGRAAHAGIRPEDGCSAIVMASQALSQMPLGRIDSETTANIGSFIATGATNVVCDDVAIEAEARSMDRRKMEQQLAAMRQASEAAADQMGGEVDFTSEVTYPSFQLHENDAVVQVAKQAVQKIGRSPELRSLGGGTDANSFNQIGIPTVVFPAGYEHNHTTNERIHVDELVKAAELVLAVIQTVKEKG